MHKGTLCKLSLVSGYVPWKWAEDKVALERVDSLLGSTTSSLVLQERLSYEFATVDCTFSLFSLHTSVEQLRKHLLCHCPVAVTICGCINGID